jgi:membrane protein
MTPDRSARVLECDELHDAVKVQQPDVSIVQQDHSPEARRRAALLNASALRADIVHQLSPGGRTLTVMKRVWVGAYQDGFIHAGNLAYTAILALFPFFICIAALFSLLGASADAAESLHDFLTALPRDVAKVIEPVARDVMAARSGWLLWLGGVFALWTVSSLIETVRDVLRRAYGTAPTAAFWRYRLVSTGLVVGAVVLLLLSLFAQVAIGAAQEVIAAWFPRLDSSIAMLTTSRLIPAAVLFASIYALFIALTPSAYRSGPYPKWPGALLVTVWWVGVTVLLPTVLRHLTNYSLTYGSLAGVMIALFFFWLVGLGMVVGAELNAALASTPEERDVIGQADDRARLRRTED